MKRGFTVWKPFVPLMLVMTGWLLNPFGKPGDVFFFLASGLALFGAIVYLKNLNTINEAERTNEIFSELRHDWMNHVQVLMGYLMMKKEDAIKNYLNRLVKQARAERIISNFSYAPLAVDLLHARHRLKEWELSFNVSEHFRFNSADEEKKFLKVWQRLVTACEKRRQQTDAYIEASFSLDKEVNQVQIEIQFSQSDPTTIRSDEWIKSLENRLKAVDSSVTVDNTEDALLLTYQLKPNELGR